MAARHALRSARHHNLPARSHIGRQIIQAATGRKAKTAYVVIGTVGIAALAIAIFGPRRFQRQVLKPVQNAVGDQALQLWADSRSLREQIGKLFDRAQSESGREKLVRSFQSWVGHFRAG
jgi:hypothetical protein